MSADDEWKWPDPPTTPRDVIASHVRNWGRKLAYQLADDLLLELQTAGFKIVSATSENTAS